MQNLFNIPNLAKNKKLFILGAIAASAAIYGSAKLFKSKSKNNSPKQSENSIQQSLTKLNECKNIEESYEIACEIVKIASKIIWFLFYILSIAYKGLFKQAKFGDCTEDKPAGLWVAEQAKWEAYNSCKGMSQNNAKEQYIIFVKDYTCKLEQNPIEVSQNESSGQSLSQSVSIIKSQYEYIDKFQSSFDSQKIENQQKIDNFFENVLNENISKQKELLEQNELDYLKCQNSQGLLAIHYSIDNEKTTSFEFLLDQYAKRNLINLPDKHGMNALYYAVLMENDQAVKLLLQKDADPFQKDFEGKFPAEQANHEIKELIFNYEK